MRIAHVLTSALLLTLTLAPVACKKGGEGTDTPDDKGSKKENGDFVAQLDGLKVELQGHIDTVMKPLADAEQLANMVAELPAKVNLEGKAKAAVLGSLKAGFEGGKATLEVDASVAAQIPAELKAEIDAILAKAVEVKAGIQALPDNVGAALKAVVEIGGKATGIATAATTSLSAKLSMPLLKAEAKAQIQGQLDSVTTLKGEIEGMVSKVQTDFSTIPQKGAELGVKLAGSFSAAGSTK